MLTAPPVVVDADVILRNVDFALRHGHVGALSRHASTGYSMLSGVVLFASADSATEVARHLSDVAERRKVDISAVEQVWLELFGPAFRFVDVPDGLVADPRIEGTHPKDRHTARLACLLAPAVLVTDNRKHFKPFGLPDTKTDSVAIDLATVGQFVTGAKGVSIIPAVTGLLTIDGSKRVIAKIGRGEAVLIAAVLAGMFAVFLNSERGRAVCTTLGGISEEIVPKLLEVIDKANMAGDRVRSFAIDAVRPPAPLELLARQLTTVKPVMTTSEIADWFKWQRVGFESRRSHQAETRAWLVRTPCFEEVARGSWALGRHA